MNSLNNSGIQNAYFYFLVQDRICVYAFFSWYTWVIGTDGFMSAFEQPKTSRYSFPFTPVLEGERNWLKATPKFKCKVGI